MTLDVSLRAKIGGFLLDVAFCAPGGITALFGASGAGKTQTLRGIAGLRKPESGRVVLDDRVLFDGEHGINVPVRDRGIGYLFQQYALFPHLDVAGNIGYGLHRWPRSERAKRIVELLALVDLPDYQGRRIRELSGGQQQRVALARALAPSPDLLLLDEPFSAVDALIRRQLRSQLVSVQEQTGIPMLLVTHDLAEVRQIATTMVLMEGGRVVATGTPNGVIATVGGKHIAALIEAAGGIVLTGEDFDAGTDDGETR